jgi:hypothetical protein
MVNVEVAALPVTPTEAGAKLQVAPVGRPEQDRATVWLKPLLGVSVTVVVADCPGATVPEEELNAAVKSGAPAVTVTVIALELLPAKVALPPYDAVKVCEPAVSEEVV